MSDPTNLAPSAEEAVDRSVLRSSCFGGRAEGPKEET